MIDMTKQVTVTKTGLDVLTHVEGQFFTFGQVTLLKKDDLIVLVKAGDQAGKKVRLPQTFPCTVDGVEYVVDVPEEVAPAETEVKVKRSKAAPGEKTKIQHCREIYALHKDDLDKAAMCALFVEEAGCTKMGANTYYLTCKKG